ncbi:Uncharacterised protein [Mycobacteroides abscessus subsp. abscessus]|nr:Uncharacterised protein [Mycobacteroides abscessus subsp. abscessus]
MSTSPSRICSTIVGSSAGPGSECLRTRSHGIPLRRNISAVPSVARMRNPRSCSRLTGNTIARLSRLAIETNTVPSVGSEP